MKNYRLIALDMDGTLLTEEKEVSRATKYWIQQLDAKGVPVILSTGRGYQRVVDIQKELEINQPMVLVNGAEVWKNQMTLLNRVFIPKEDIGFLRRIAIKYDASYWGYTTEKMIKEKYFRNDMLTWNWLKFGIKHEDISVINKIRQTIMTAINIECTSSNQHNIECAPPGITKEVGLIQVCKHLDIPMREVVAVGDHLNDMEMIKASGVGVAMGNATTELKKVADTTTFTNEQDGVASVIKKYFFDM